MHAVAGGVDEHSGGSIDHVAGGDLGVTGLQDGGLQIAVTVLRAGGAAR